MFFFVFFHYLRHQLVEFLLLLLVRFLYVITVFLDASRVFY